MIGDTASGVQALRFSIDEVVPDIACTADYYTYTPENGHLVGLRLSVQTQDLDEFGGRFSLEAKDFSYIGVDGVTLTNIQTLPAYACLQLESEEFSQEPMRPSQRYTGTMVLDVPATAGTLVYAPSYLDNGWEWVF